MRCPLCDGSLCWPVLPINLTGNRIKARPPDKPAQVSTSTFARLTISNIKKGSEAYW